MDNYLIKSRDEELRYTLGVAYPVKQVDTDGHFANAPALRKAAWEYIKNMQEDDDVEKVAKSIFEEIIKTVKTGNELRIDVTDMDIDSFEKNLKDMHQNPVNDCYVVESYIAPADMDIDSFEKNLKDMHQNPVNDCYVVESYIAPADMNISGEEIHKGDWLLGVVWSKEMFEKIKSGERTGYSIGGKGVLVDSDEF